MNSQQPAAGARDEPVLEVHDIAVHFGGVKAVDGISFALHGAQIFGLLGPNGSGKSTLLAGISRLINLTSGTLSMGGQPYQQAPASSLAARGLARTFQTVRLVDELTVLENVLVAADAGARRGKNGWTLRAARRAADAAARDSIARVGLSGSEQRYPSQLSYGMQRRVEIARAITARPTVLLLDEPTAGMNNSERQEISSLLSSLRSEGLAQLLVEHDVQMMVDTCDYLFAMNFGKIIAEGPPAEVVQTAEVRAAYLGRKWAGRASS